MAGRREKRATKEALPHWYARYTQVYRRRMECMRAAKELQHQLRLSDLREIDCMRTRVSWGQGGGKSPVSWNQKACTCHKCQATALVTYYPGILYLNSHNSHKLRPIQPQARSAPSRFDWVVENAKPGPLPPISSTASARTDQQTIQQYLMSRARPTASIPTTRRTVNAELSPAIDGYKGPR